MDSGNVDLVEAERMASDLTSPGYYRFGEVMHQLVMEVRRRREAEAAAEPPADVYLPASLRRSRTRTYAIAEVPPEVYAHVRAVLEAAGYSHAFHIEDGSEVIDMDGIALSAKAI
jgi:hypothetical protein